MRRTPLPLVLAVLLVLAACGGGKDDEKPGAASSTTATPGTTGTATPTGTASGTASATPTTTGSATPDPTGTCAPPRRGVVPDGTWEGPIALDVRGQTDDQGQGYADSTGTGTMRLVVEDGAVTRGTWTVRWRSEGHADSGGAKATVTVTGTVTGKVGGPARRPALTGDWRLQGKAVITEPVRASSPIDETGSDKERMTVTAVTCTGVTGTFVPSFNSKETLATFTGTATWTGSRVR